MDLVNCIRTREKGKHLKFEERQELERIIRKKTYYAEVEAKNAAIIV